MTSSFNIFFPLCAKFQLLIKGPLPFWAIGLFNGKAFFCLCGYYFQIPKSSWAHELAYIKPSLSLRF